ncbi:uncharacterized protein BDR25DRAFT_393815 [Lindgomyces ingoldianus]|uniref:Uncharacterized protein n=1 Tax=Lindgomyces ingoldianus TaxID=673940 RepID=A0ACB6QUY4_9PLEO|nr:uncharacterized protein BDR25DRAFT_393815 [Lindgomyces ingoldianus]KAF2470829.1 hypothetical protein BDR25DRAFT_393815 [Lindgomyces ingoldianus]
MKRGAGVTVSELYEAAEPHGVISQVEFLLMPSSRRRPHSVIRLLRDGCHHALTFKVVTADGHFVTASETSYPDLFWTLHGGGSGIAPEYASDSIKLRLGNTTFATASREIFWLGVRKYFESSIMYTNAGFYSFFFALNSGGQLTLRINGLFAPNHTIESLNKITKPWMNRLKEPAVLLKMEQNTAYFFPGYMDAWGSHLFPVRKAHSLLGNRLLSRRSFMDLTRSNATFNVMKTHVEVERHLGGGGRPCAFSSPRQPGSRVGNITAAEMKIASDELTNNILPPWREVAPAGEGGGSYPNEAQITEPNWQDGFYGSHYTRLLKIKRKYDPGDLFYATPTVGSKGLKMDGLVVQKKRDKFKASQKDKDYKIKGAAVHMGLSNLLLWCPAPRSSSMFIDHDNMQLKEQPGVPSRVPNIFETLLGYLYQMDDLAHNTDPYNHHPQYVLALKQRKLGIQATFNSVDGRRVAVLVACRLPRCAIRDNAIDFTVAA